MIVNPSVRQVIGHMVDRVGSTHREKLGRSSQLIAKNLFSVCEALRPLRPISPDVLSPRRNHRGSMRNIPAVTKSQRLFRGQLKHLRDCGGQAGRCYAI